MVGKRRHATPAPLLLIIACAAVMILLIVFHEFKRTGAPSLEPFTDVAGDGGESEVFPGAHSPPHISTPTPQQTPAAIAGACPATVSRDVATGQIIVQIGGGTRAFASVKDYAAAMSVLLSHNPACVIPTAPDIATAPPPPGNSIPAYSTQDIALKRQTAADVKRNNALAAAAHIMDRPFVTSPIFDVQDYTTPGASMGQMHNETTDLVDAQQSTSPGPWMKWLDNIERNVRDWSSYPPESKHFEGGFTRQERAKRVNCSDGQDCQGQFDLSLETAATLPPDLLRQEAAERKALKEYGPRSTPLFWEPPLEDVQEVVNSATKQRSYTSRIARTGPGQYSVVEVTPRRETVAFNDPGRNIGYGNVPIATAAPGSNVLFGDPYFDSGVLPPMPFAKNTDGTGSGSIRNWSDFTKWTPGLERAFAPSYPTNDWS